MILEHIGHISEVHGAEQGKPMKQSAKEGGKESTTLTLHATRFGTWSGNALYSGPTKKRRLEVKKSTYSTSYPIGYIIG